jgi:SynChlorMet cassette radical SAM/SPASM protein ScmF
MTVDRVELPAGVPALNTYYAYLTSGCNLACQHCWLSPAYQPEGGTGGHLDFDLFTQAIEEGLPLGLSSVKLTGGEPLLHPDFVKIVDLLQQKQLGLTIETNGTLMTRELAFYLKEHSTLGHISVSVDGASAATHDPFRGVKGSFERAVQGTGWLVEAGFRPQVIMSLHAGNVEEIEALVRLAEGLGAGSVKFNLIQPTGRGERLTERGKVLDMARLIEIGRWVEGELQKRSGLALFYSWPMAFQGLRRLGRDGSDSCGIFGILGVLASGLYAMCGIGVQIPELSYGLIGQDRLAEVWAEHPMLVQLRESLPAQLEGVCAECLFQAQCLGSCVAENYHQTRRLTAAYWFCAQAAEAGLFPLARLRNDARKVAV